MTREEATLFGELWLDINEDCKDSQTYAFVCEALKALRQAPNDNSIITTDKEYIYETQKIEWKDEKGNDRSHIVKYKICPVCGTVKESTFIRNRS